MPAMTRQAKPIVLIVEDEAMILIDLSETFRRADYDVVLAANLSAARSLAAAHRSDLVGACLDLGLPDGRGDALVDEIATFSPNARILLCTAYSAREIDSEAFRRGQAVLLEKPFPASEALRLIQSAPGKPLDG
jgi:DNA-binding NtrC family response regulator